VIDNPLAQLPLRAAAVLYGALVRARNRYYDREGVGHRARVPVVSVGNLTVGGTGKTPLVAWLATRLQQAGRRPAIVSRGYRGTVGRGPRVVSRGADPTCGPAECGDEPYLLASTLPGVPVVVGADRAAAADAATELGSDVLLLDDGFQHRRLERDLDIVLLDSGRPFGNERLLPAGTLREPPAALARAGIVLVSRSAPGERHPEIERIVRRHNGSVPILHCGHRRLGFFDSSGDKVEAPQRAMVFCGIGNPAAFRADVEAEGVEIAGFEARRDHQRYLVSDLERLAAHADALSSVLVTTEKDRVRLPDIDGEPSRVLTLRIEARPFEPERLMDALEATLTGRTTR